MVHLLPSDHLIPLPSHTPLASAGPSSDEKSTTMMLSTTSPTNRQTSPLPSSGQPGLPAVPLMAATPSFLTTTMRLQFGWFGSSYWWLKVCGLNAAASAGRRGGANAATPAVAVAAAPPRFFQNVLRWIAAAKPDTLCQLNMEQHAVRKATNVVAVDDGFILYDCWRKGAGCFCQDLFYSKELSFFLMMAQRYC